MSLWVAKVTKSSKYNQVFWYCSNSKIQLLISHYPYKKKTLSHDLKIPCTSACVSLLRSMNIMTEISDCVLLLLNVAETNVLLVEVVVNSIFWPFSTKPALFVSTERYHLSCHCPFISTNYTRHNSFTDSENLRYVLGEYVAYNSASDRDQQNMRKR